MLGYIILAILIGLAYYIYTYVKETKDKLNNTYNQVIDDNKQTYNALSNI